MAQTLVNWFLNNKCVNLKHFATSALRFFFSLTFSTPPFQYPFHFQFELHSFLFFSCLTSNIHYTSKTSSSTQAAPPFGERIVLSHRKLLSGRTLLHFANNVNFFLITIYYHWTIIIIHVSITTYRIGQSYFKQVLRLCVKSTTRDPLADLLAACEHSVLPVSW